MRSLNARNEVSHDALVGAAIGAGAGLVTAVVATTRPTVHDHSEDAIGYVLFITLGAGSGLAVGTWWGLFGTEQAVVIRRSTAFFQRAMNRSRVRIRLCAGAVVVLIGACAPKHMHTTDCGFDSFPAPQDESRMTWTHTADGGRLDGQVLERGGKGLAVKKAMVLLPQPGGWDTLRIPVDSTGAFHSDSLPIGRRQVIVEARWY